jgi:DNA-binding NarL/FixJ family response regulator
MTTGTESRPPHDASSAPIRVVVVDPRPLIADALAQVVAGAGFGLVTTVSGDLSMAPIAAGGQELVLVGVGADPHAMLGQVRTLALRIGGASIVLIADALTPELVTCVLDQSLGGLLLTEHPAEDLVTALRHIARGRAVLPAGWQGELAAGPAGPLDMLSERQLEVLQLLAEGCSYEEIGARLFISVNTVKFHMRSIFERLGVRNRMAAVRVLSEAARA